MNETPATDGMEAKGVSPEKPVVEEGGSGLRPPKQERSRRTLDRIVAAALELLRESGVEGTTVSAIVKRASTSVGSFYARFSGKDELVRYLRDRFRGEVLARWDAGAEAVDWPSLPLSARVREAVALLARAYGEDWILGRVLDGGSGRPGEEGGWWALDFRQHVLVTLSQTLLVPEDEVLHPRPEVALETGFRMVAGALRDAVEVDGAMGKEAAPDPLGSLARELAGAWTAYLETSVAVEPEDQREAGTDAALRPDQEPTPETAPTPQPAPSAGADFFDPWG